jgi:hypothetical protein
MRVIDRLRKHGSVIGAVVLTVAITVPVVRITAKTSIAINGPLGLVNFVSHSQPPLPATAEPKPQVFKKDFTGASVKGARMAILNPALQAVHWRTGEIVGTRAAGPGTVSGIVSFSVFNVGDKLAQNVTAQWFIDDTGQRITTPDEWRRSQGQSVMPPFDVAPGTAAQFLWTPEIRGSGLGTLTLRLVIHYQDGGLQAQTHYNGRVEYSVPDEGQRKQYLFSPV